MLDVNTFLETDISLSDEDMEEYMDQARQHRGNYLRTEPIPLNVIGNQVEQPQVAENRLRPAPISLNNIANQAEQQTGGNVNRGG